jgi:DUF1680 family protein
VWGVILCTYHVLFQPFTGLARKKWMKFNRTEIVNPVIENLIPDQMHPVPYQNQRIGGLIGTRLNSNINKALLNYPVEEYLRVYHGDRMARWPAGEYLGKYMQADAVAFQYSGNQSLADQMAAVAEAWIASLPEDGYHVIRGPHEMHERWKGAWEVWELKYMIVGLIAMYRLAGDERLINNARRIGDCIVETFGYGEGQIDLLEVGALRIGTTSILEPMVDLYRYTGEQKYLDFCNYIMAAHEQEPNGTKIISELLKGSGEVDQVGGPGVWQKGKAYEMISSFVGVLRMYRLTGEEETLKAMLAAWRDIVDHRLFITGTTSNHEFFMHRHVLPAESQDNVGEGCVTAHWMFFNCELFLITGETRFIDEIEKTIYNALLASQDPHLGLQSYFTPLNGSRGYVMYGVNTGGPPCCSSSVAREIARIPATVWSKPRDGSLAVLLYAPGSVRDTVLAVDGSEIELALKSETDFPHTGDVKLTVQPEREAEATLLLRVPKWCRSYQVRIKEDAFVGTPGTFLNITRSWVPGDVVQISMELPIQILDGGHSYPFHHALQRGPQVLAVDSWLSDGDVDSARFDPQKPVKLEAVTANTSVGWSGDQIYSSDAVTLKDGGAARLAPFTDVGQLGWTYNHDRRMYGSHSYRVWIKDKDAPRMTWHRIPDTDPGWTFSGEISREESEYLADATTTRIADGESMEIQFNGRMVRVMGAFERSHADIYIDDDIYRDIKWYPMGRGGHRPFQSRFLEPGEHTLRIVAKGPIRLDYIDILEVCK